MVLAWLVWRRPCSPSRHFLDGDPAGSYRQILGPGCRHPKFADGPCGNFGKNDGQIYLTSPSTTFLKPVSPVLNQIGLPIELTKGTVVLCQTLEKSQPTNCLSIRQLAIFVRIDPADDGGHTQIFTEARSHA